VDLSSLGLKAGDRLVLNLRTTVGPSEEVGAPGQRPYEFKVVRGVLSGVVVAAPQIGNRWRLEGRED
jgi:hypothetical protein